MRHFLHFYIKMGKMPCHAHCISSPSPCYFFSCFNLLPANEKPPSPPHPTPASRLPPHLPLIPAYRETGDLEQGQDGDLLFSIAASQTDTFALREEGPGLPAFQLLKNFTCWQWDSFPSYFPKSMVWAAVCDIFVPLPFRETSLGGSVQEKQAGMTACLSCHSLLSSRPFPPPSHTYLLHTTHAHGMLNHWQTLQRKRKRTWKPGEPGKGEGWPTAWPDQTGLRQPHQQLAWESFQIHSRSEKEGMGMQFVAACLGEPSPTFPVPLPPSLTWQAGSGGGGGGQGDRGSGSRINTQKKEEKGRLNGAFLCAPTGRLQGGKSRLPFLPSV